MSAEVKLIPQTTTVLTDEEQLKFMEKLVDMLEEDDDVQSIAHNWEIEE
ncbi:YebC/PmpR family DNA-binding transcriptional regulator [Romboutsia sp. 1001713B170131_170501_G6]